MVRIKTVVTVWTGLFEVDFVGVGDTPHFGAIPAQITELAVESAIARHQRTQGL